MIQSLVGRAGKALSRSLASHCGVRIVRATTRMPPDCDPVSARIVDTVMGGTMASRERVYAMVEAVRHVSRHSVEGAIVECGVWKGGCMQSAAMAIIEEEVAPRALFLFDTFAGMSPPSEYDVSASGVHASVALARADVSSRTWAVASVDEVRDRLSWTNYPDEHIHLIQGRVEDTIPEFAPEKIAVLRLDTDWYESTKHELKHLYPRLVSGGVLLLDDYGGWLGARKAVDEFLKDTGERLMMVRTDEGRIAVKP